MNKKILLMALLGAASMPVMAEGQWKYSTGVDYSSGDYGGDPVDTNTTYVPFSASYSTATGSSRAVWPGWKWRVVAR